MAMPWPHGTPTLPRPVRAVSPAAAPSDPRTLPGASTARRVRATFRPAVPAGAVAVATAPATALVAMLVGLTLLFALPPVGLPFVALVVLPAAVYHLRPEHRTALRRPRT